MRTLLASTVITLVAAAGAAQQTPMQQALPVPKVDFRWDLLLRYDNLDNFPRPTPVSFHRTRLQVRPGLLYTPVPWVTIEGRLIASSDTRDRDRSPLGDGTSRTIGGNDHLTFTGRQDNYLPDSVLLDRLNVQFRPTAGTMLTVGKFENPFDMTEALWDRDLQPEGLAGSIDFGAVEGVHSRVTAGFYVGTQLYGDESRILGGQYSLLSGTEWPLDVSLSAGYYRFDELDVLARRNWRQNATELVGGVRQFVSDYEIGDVLLRIGTDRVAGTPMRLHIDYIRNFGAEPDTDDGIEAGIQVGPIPGPLPVRFNYVYQDLERDAVQAGFNGDDWYLHSWYRGSLYRLSVPVWREFNVQATYVDMNHHETTYDTTRLMLDVVKRF